MGRKKNKNKKKTELNKKSGQKKKTFFLYAAIGGLVVLMLTGYLFSKKGPPIVPERPIRKLVFDLIETRPVLSPALFRGRIALAYQYAAEIPEVMDNQFCYCYCRQQFNHKTLLTCFTENHGAECSICQNEVFRTYQLYKKGFTINEIVKKIDKEFYRPPPPVRRGL